MGFHSSVKKNEIKDILEKWIKLENIIQSEATQVQKDTIDKWVLTSTLCPVYLMWGTPGSHETKR